MESILIIKTSAIGDVIQSFPVVDYLHRCFPEAKISWVVEKASSGLVGAHPHIYEVLSVDTKRWKKQLFSLHTWKEIKAFLLRLREKKYDVVFDLQGNTKSGVLLFFARAKDKVGFSWNSVPEKCNVLFTTMRFDVERSISCREQYVSLARCYFRNSFSFASEPLRLLLNKEETDKKKTILSTFPFDGSFRLMVAFGSNWKNKQLSEETLLACLTALSQHRKSHLFFVFGSSKEKEQAERLQSFFSRCSTVLEEMTLPLLQAVIYEMDGVFTVDSAALHLCGTTTTPSFSVFGSSSSLIYKPLSERHYSVQGVCPYGKQFVKRCPVLRSCSTGSCIKDLSAENLGNQLIAWSQGVRKGG